VQSVWRSSLMTMLLAAASWPATGNPEPESRLAFDVDEGPNLNSFLREGPVAAHLLLRSGSDPRVLIAFPAGNSGVGLWFSHGAQPVKWTLQGRPQPLTTKDARGRPLYGMTAEAIATGSADLRFKQAVLSSVRVLRDYQALGTFPAEVAVSPTIQDSTITWARDRLDGAAGYRLSIQVTHGALHADGVAAGSDGKIAVTITALSGEQPLTPLGGAHLLTDQAQPDPAARNVLTFLSYKEKFLAGSWRFNTYFGRDTLMSVRLLMPVLAPEAVDAGLGAVLTRLSPHGEVAHEEDIGEFAILDHLRAGGEKSDAPVFNYNMIDGSFMLAPVAAEWLLNDARGRTRAAAFLKRMDGRQKPTTLGADLVSNFKFVLKAAAKFASDPRAPNLIALKPGFDAGQWRDSNDGLGGGRIPYDVNAVFVPAALEAAAHFFQSGLLAAYLNSADRELFSHAKLMAATWRERAGPLFDMSVPNATARRDITDYAAALQITDRAALDSVDDAAVSFPALSLTAEARTIAVIHSDIGFELLFGRPSSTSLDSELTALMRPFPAGLLTPVGVVVANPVYAAPIIQGKLTRSAYHGTVIWSWQQAVLAAGLRRQLQREDLSAPRKEHLRAAQSKLWRAIGAAHSMRNSELWTWSFEQGHFEIAPFGANASDADESNAAQLWSTVYLAIPPP
jgi:hypothetical protein